MQMQIMPDNQKAEEQVIGMMILDMKARYKVLQTAKAEHFHKPLHAIIYAAVSSIVKEKGDVSITSICEKIGEETLGNMGGSYNVIEIAQSVVSSTNVDYYLGIVKDYYLRRSLINICERTLSKAYEGTADNPTGSILDEHTDSIRKIESSKERIFYSFPEITQKGIESIQEANDLANVYGTEGFSTGFNDLDFIIKGIKKKQQIVIAARPSMGKSSLALQLAVHFTRQGAKVALISYEMPVEEIGRRMIMQNVNLKGTLTKDGAKQIIQWCDGNKTLQFWVSDIGQNINELETDLSALNYESDGLNIAIIDYIGLIELGHRHNRSENSVLTEISRRLKLFAMRNNITTIALSQLNRDIERRNDPKPNLADLRDSGSVEQDADIVMFLYPPAKQNSDNDIWEMNLFIAKNRNGSLQTISLDFNRPKFLFAENNFGPMQLAEGQVKAAARYNRA